MKHIFSIGDKKQVTYVVQSKDFAIFQGKMVHPVCSTFVLAREIEWATRQYVLECKEESEEGIGTLLEIQHLGPAFEGEEIEIQSEIISINDSEIICTFQVSVGERKVASGKTGQKILPKTKINQLFEKVKREQ